MSIFSRKKPKTEDPPKVDNALSTTRPFFVGNATAGVFVNEDAAMNLASVSACVRAITSPISSIPFQVYRRDGAGRMPAPEHPLYPILHDEPNPEMTSQVFRETLLYHLLIWGNAYAQIVREKSGRVKALYPLLPNQMDVRRDQSGEIFYTYWRSEDDKRKGDKTGQVIFRKESVLHIPGLSYNGLVGYSPIAMARNAIGLAIATEEYGASFFANSANPSGILEHAKTLEHKDAIRETWESLYRGGSRARGLAILEEGLTFKTISVPPEDAQFLQTRRFQVEEICRIFNVPPHIIFDMERSTFNNVEHMSLGFVLYSLNPWVSRLEQSFNQALLLPSEKPEYFTNINVDGLLRGNYEARMKGYSVGRQNGWLSANDIRKLENMNPIPAERGGDKYLINGNMCDLENAGLFAKVNMASMLLKELGNIQNVGKDNGLKVADSGAEGTKAPDVNPYAGQDVDPKDVLMVLARKILDTFGN